MAQNRMTQQALLDQIQAADPDVLRRVLEHAMQRLIEAEAAAQIGAGPHERASTRTTYRNGYRERVLDTGSGRLELQIPKLRSGSFFPSLLEPRRRIDRALRSLKDKPWADDPPFSEISTSASGGDASAYHLPISVSPTVAASAKSCGLPCQCLQLLSRW